MVSCRPAAAALVALALCASARAAGEACNVTTRSDQAAMEFCGRDGTRHAWSCEAFYQYGNVSYTGYDDANPTPLRCLTAVGNPSVGWFIGVVFGCNGYGNGAEPDHPNEAVVMRHHRKCVAAHPTGMFECTDMAGVTDSEFEDFLDAVNNTVLRPCDNGEAAQYIYLAEVGRMRDGVDSEITMQGTNSSSVWNETLALRAMRAKYDYSTTQVPPTTVPSTSAPATAPPENAGGMAQPVALMALGLLVAAML